MLHTPEYKAFYHHRRNSKGRGISFEFTWEQWHSWWQQNLGPDWFKLRGCAKGQFVMARNGDKGPYAPWNVKCLTAVENNKEQAAHGLCGFTKGHKNYRKACGSIPHQNGIRITPEEAVDIFNAQGTQRMLAQKYGVSARLVRLIKKKQVWKHIL